MIIGVDAGCLGILDKRLEVGVYQFALNLLKGISKIDNKNKYYLYSFSPIKKDVMNELGVNFTNKVLLPKIGWFKFRLPVALLFDKVDLFLGLSQAMPSDQFKTIGFVHALDFYPEFHKDESIPKMKENTDFLINNAQLIVVASNFLAKSVKKINKKTKVKVLPLASAEYFSPDGKNHSEKSPYFLFIGTLKPSKNIENILIAFSRFMEKEGKKFKLLLIGSDFWTDKDINQIINKYGLTKNVDFLGFIENNKLPPFYRGAVALLSPSFYEGFGIPLVEAMASGAPVIAGNQTAERELISKGGILVNPLDPDQISNAMRSIYRNTNRYKKAAIIESKNFNWENYAKGLLSEIKKYEK